MLNRSGGQNFQSPDDVALIQAVVRREPEAFDVLYERYVRFVYSISLRILNHSELAEEVTLDVFERVWEKADSFEAARGSVKSWLARMTRNRAIDRLRYEQVRPDFRALSWEDWFQDLHGGRPGPESRAAAELQRGRVREAIEELPPEQQVVLAYAFFGGYSHREIAEQLSLPLGTVKTRVRLAMQKLAFLLRDESQGENRAE